MKKFALLLFCVAFMAMQVVNAQVKSISGTVTSSEDGSTIPGVSVIVKGTTMGTVTNMDGYFQFDAPQDATTLVFSFVGMRSLEVPISGSTVNAVLEFDVIGVDEVVITAYGKRGKVGLKGSITTVGSEELDQIPIATFDQALQGKTTGVYIASGSGQPGTEKTKVRIRGSASINGSNDPLYILDGMPIEGSQFASLNPNDFETVSVLKDASATSIYGSRASNGVIYITTKRGKAGKTTVTYRFQNGWSNPSRENFEMMDSPEKLAFEELATRGTGWNLSPNNPLVQNLSPAEQAETAAELARLRNINVDWSDVFFRTGKTTSHEVNLNGGSESTKVFFSLQNFEQEGIGLRSDLNRSSGRLNLDHNINDKMRFSLTSMLGNTKSSRIESENSISLANSFAAVYLANPYDEPYDSDGNIITGGGLTGPNALDRLMTSTNDKDELKGVGSLSLEYDIIEGLTFKTVGGIDYRNTTYERWIDPDSYAGGQVTNGEQGSIAETYRKFTEVNWSNTFDYTKEISDVHLFTVLVGSEYLKRDYIGWNFTGYGLNNKLPGTPAAITPGTADNNFIPGVGGFKTARSLFSLFSTLNYTYNSKYNLFASLRRDGSSAFGANNRYATLYSLGLTWHMSEESFMANMNWINNLKFRVSYGTTGNQEGIANFESLTTYGTTSYGGVPGISLARAGDPNIKWEIGEKFNMGIDYNIFNNRVSGNIDVYNDITSDLFITQTLSAVNGVPGNSKDVNAGRMRNRGIEFLVNADVVRTQDFVWSVGANISYNQNEILSLGQEDEFEVGTSIIRVGLPYGSHYIVKWAGVDPSTGNPLYYTKDGEVTETYAGSDAVADFGTDETPMFGGFNTKVSYKGFEVSAFFTFANDYKRFNNQTFFQENANFTQFNLLKIMETVWQKPGDITEIQRLGTERQFSSKDIEDASFLRFRNLLVAYNLPQKLLKRTNFFKNVRIYGQGQNLFVWTKFTGFDPEDDNNIAGYEYPSARTFTFGVDVSF